MGTHELDKLNETRSSLKPEGVDEIGKHVRSLLADIFALYLMTKNFHWHMHGSHFRDYHLLLDEQGDQIFAMTDAIAERGRKIGVHTLRSIGEIARYRRLSDNDEYTVSPNDMLAELCQDKRNGTCNHRPMWLHKVRPADRGPDRWCSVRGGDGSGACACL
jgi:DNA-binding ferritin-like protein